MSSKKVEDIVIEYASKHFGFGIDEMKELRAYELQGDDVWMVSFYINIDIASMKNHKVEYMAVVNIATGKVQPLDIL